MVVYIGNCTKLTLNWELKLFYITLVMGSTVQGLGFHEGTKSEREEAGTEGEAACGLDDVKGFFGLPRSFSLGLYIETPFILKP